MITIVQRVIEAKVQVAGEVVGAIGPGLLALTAVVRGDGEKEIAWTAGKLATLRIFRSGEGADAKHFDKDVREMGGSILLVSNFTVCASTRQGRRPSLDRAAEPAVAEAVFARLVEAVRAQGVPVETGVFGGDMKVSLHQRRPRDLHPRQRGTLILSATAVSPHRTGVALWAGLVFSQRRGKEIW